MKMYKGFDKDFRCRGMQFEVGKTYEESKAKLCKSGFHACEHPLDVFRYYGPADSRFAEVELDGETDEKEDNTKRAGTKITIGEEIGLHGLIDAAVKFVLSKATWSDKDKDTGYRGAASAKGKESCSISLGIGAKAKASLGSWITIAEWKEIDGDWHRVDVKTRKVDGKRIKADTWYSLKGGKFIEAENA